MSQMKPINVEIAEPIYIPTDQSGEGEPATTQVFPVQLSGAPSGARRRFVVCANFPVLNPMGRESVAARLRGGGAACDFIIREAEGEATVVADLGEDGAAAFEAAAAVAAVKASCGWDESNPIIVRINDTALSVVAQSDGGRWLTSVAEVGR
jgi:hypothetical protein